MSRWFTISEIAGLVGDSEHNIQEFIREDRIPYVSFSNGILIPLGGFQNCMSELYDMTTLLSKLSEENDDV